MNLLEWIRKTGGGPSLSGKDDIAHVLYVKRHSPDVYEKTCKFLGSKDYFNLRLTGEFAATHRLDDALLGDATPATSTTSATTRRS